MDRFMVAGHALEVSFSERGDWEGAFAVEVIEKAMADREDGQRGFLITGEEVFLEKYTIAGEDELPEFFDRLRVLVSQRGRDHELSGQVDQLEDLAYQWTVEAAEPEIAARREMNTHPETLKDVAVLLQSGTGKGLIDEIREAFDAFVDTEVSFATARYVDARRTNERATLIVIVLLVVAIGLGSGIALATSRAIARPLARLVKGADAVGSRDLTTRVEVTSSDELGELARAFNQMVSRLEEAAAKRHQLESQLLRAQKLESIGQLAAGIAHEINTPTSTLGTIPSSYATTSQTS